MKRKYGEKSNVVRVRVYGEFPENEDDTMIPIAWLEGSVATEMSDDTALAMGAYRDNTGKLLEADVSKVTQIEIGCDVARFGDDKTCIGYRVNEKVEIYKKYNGQDTNWTASNVAKLFLQLSTRFKYHDVIYAKVDDGGVGGGVVDQLKSYKRTQPELFQKLQIVPVNFGQKIKHKYYDDTTTFMMGVVKDLISPIDENGQPHKPEIILPNDNDLIGQLSCRKYYFTSNGKQKVESKKEMKERGLTSPDEADCILLVCLPMKKKGGNGKNGSK